jgi:hypothetical protein
MPVLAISPEKVCFVIIKAREFDVKDEVTEPDAGSNPSDDKMISVLEDHGDDPVVEELTSFISSLSEDEQIDLCRPCVAGPRRQHNRGLAGAARGSGARPCQPGRADGELPARHAAGG